MNDHRCMSSKIEPTLSTTSGRSCPTHPIMAFVSYLMMSFLAIVCLLSGMYLNMVSILWLVLYGLWYILQIFLLNMLSVNSLLEWNGELSL